MAIMLPGLYYITNRKHLNYSILQVLGPSYLNLRNFFFPVKAFTASKSLYQKMASI